MTDKRFSFCRLTKERNGKLSHIGTLPFAPTHQHFAKVKEPNFLYPYNNNNLSLKMNSEITFNIYL